MKNINIRGYTAADLDAMIAIWNEVVEEGIAFPQEEALNPQTGAAFFGSQTHCGVAQDADTGEIVGLYILHPNNVGRCGHISNASYAVASGHRGLHIGEKLVLDSLQQAKQNGFSIMQFNAVVTSNVHAQHLYERLGFQRVGMIPQGFRLKNGQKSDIFVYYNVL